MLVTGDGMPMLLDFNLAREPLGVDDADAGPRPLGGTLDYMAPEHLEALADGLADAGRRPVRHLRPGRPPVRGADGRAAVRRRRAAAASVGRGPAAARPRSGAASRPGSATTHPEVPAALEAVVRRCLAPDPADRYADGGRAGRRPPGGRRRPPLPFAREPIAIRLLARSGATAAAMAATAVVLLTLGLAGFLSMTTRVAELKARIVGERLRRGAELRPGRPGVPGRRVQGGRRTLPDRRPPRRRFRGSRRP